MKLDLHFPAPGQRLTLPQLAGASDSLAVTQLANAERTVMLIAANGADVQRYADEIAWWAQELGRELRIGVFPDWETLPYDTFSPHHDLVSERLATLHRLAERQVDVLIVGATTALQRLAPPSFMAAYTFAFTQGQQLDAEKLRAQLVLAGYANVSQVMSPGEYAVRGGLIDLFPMGSVVPYRLDLFDDEIESIRTFDVDTQRSLYPVKEVRLLPGREFPFDENARTAFRKRFREAFEGDPSRSNIYKDIAHGVAGAGIEYYLPLFFDETATLFRYLPQDAAIVLAGEVDASIRHFWSDTQSRYRFLAADRERPILPPATLYLDAEDFFTLLKPHARVVMHAGSDHGVIAHPLPALGVDRRANDPIGGLRQFATNASGRVLILAESPGRRDTMQEFFAEFGFKPQSVDSVRAFLDADEPRIGLGVAPLATGFTLGEGDAALHVITEAELYASAGRRRGRRKQEHVTAVDAIIKDLSELKVGDPVVHAQHGIGRYQGLVTMSVGDGNNEFLQLEYANATKLYVPVAQLHLVSRYSGVDPESAPLHSLGSGQWDKARRKAAQQIRDTAAELLNLYARRAARQGHKFEFSKRDYEAFCEGFGFEETPDQAAAIEAVMQDMTSGAPMDRLVCGDVGFGKTEVALRAAFMAVGGGHRVGGWGSGGWGRSVGLGGDGIV